MQRGTHGEPTGDVRQYVDSTIGLHHLVDGLRNRIRLQQVGLQGQHLGFLRKLVSGSRQSLVADVEQCQTGAAAGEGASHRLAQIAGGARNDNYLVLEFHRSYLLSIRNDRHSVTGSPGCLQPTSPGS